MTVTKNVQGICYQQASMIVPVQCLQDSFLYSQGYAVTQELGRGMFGRVCEAVDAAGGVYAIKRVDFARMARPSARGAFAAAQDELAVARVLEAHPAPHVVRVHRTLTDCARGAYYIVMERLRGNTLRDLIARFCAYRCGLRDETILKNCVLSVLEGVRELEARRIVHRDIKPENVFVCDRGTYTEVKLIDFGLGRLVRGGDELMRSFVGTPLYMAPGQDAAGEYTWECDVWSAGMCAYFAATGCDLVAADAQTYRAAKQSVRAMCSRADYHLSGLNPGSGAERVIKMMLSAGARCEEILKDAWFHGCYRPLDPYCPIDDTSYDVKCVNGVNVFKSASCAPNATSGAFTPAYVAVQQQQQQQPIYFCGPCAVPQVCYHDAERWSAVRRNFEGRLVPRVLQATRPVLSY